MYKSIILVLALSCFQISCGSDDESELICATSDMVAYAPRYTYATENTNDACYAHGLEVIERRNSYTPDYYDYNDQCSLASQTSPTYNPQHRIDTIEEKFVTNFENLNVTEVEELTNLICGREYGDENYTVDSLENFEVVNGDLVVLVIENDTLRTKKVRSHLDTGFNCPLYSFSCYDVYTTQED